MSKASFLRIASESLFWCTLALALALLVQGWVSLANMAFLFLGPVIIMAGRRGLTGGLFTALLATMGFNFFLVPPAYTLRVDDIDNLVTMLVLAATAILVSQFAAKLAAQAQRAEALSLAAKRLSALSEALALSRDATSACAAAQTMIADWSGAQMQYVGEAQTASLAPLDAAAARWALAHQVEAGRGTNVMAAADALYMPVTGGDQRLIAQFWHESGRVPLPPETRDLVRQALMRTGMTLARIAVDARQQHDQVRETVLASIGHDLRTPLTSIMAGLAAMPVDADGVVAATQAEARRLEQLVTNILDLARLRSDAVATAMEAIDLTDAVDAVLSALAMRLKDHQVIVSLASDLPLVRSDARMLRHMLLNLLDNAAKFSAAGTVIAIKGGVDDGALVLAIVDQGRGLMDSAQAMPVRRSDDAVPGSGLGLMVVSGFAKALGLTFVARNRSDGEVGASMEIRFPPALCIMMKSDSL